MVIIDWLLTLYHYKLTVSVSLLTNATMKAGPCRHRVCVDARDDFDRCWSRPLAADNRACLDEYPVALSSQTAEDGRFLSSCCLQHVTQTISICNERDVNETQANRHLHLLRATAADNSTSAALLPTACLVAQWLGRWIRNREVASSTPGGCVSE